jgi:glycosyltransferase involved in cell wall biosynthesis
MQVLQLGPLYNNQLRRWSAHAAALGCTVSAAGHVSPGRRPVDLAGVAEQIEFAPDGLARTDAAGHVAWLEDVFTSLGPDLVHAHWLPRWGYFATLCAPCPVVVTAWGSDVYLASGAQRTRADHALRDADQVLARSRHMRDEMVARGVPASRIRCADLGVDLARFRPAGPDEQDRLRGELGLPAGPIVLSFRAGTELYNLDVILEAFRILRTRRADVTLLLVHGDAPLAGRVRALLHELGPAGGVRSVGRVAHADMAKYMRAATVGVSIPRSDGSPSSVWEALASGLPVVLSDLPQIHEKVRGSGAVKLVEPRPDAVASALLEVMSGDSRPRMALAARAWAQANVDERDQVARLGEVYAATVARPTRARRARVRGRDGRSAATRATCRPACRS